MDSVRLESYSKALCDFPDDEDTLAVLDKLVKRPRADYEAKIPEMGDFLGMVRERRRERIAAREMALREQAHADYLQDIREHPDKYVSITELLAEYKSRRTEAK